MTYWDALARAAGASTELPAPRPQWLLEVDDGVPAPAETKHVDQLAPGRPAIDPPPGAAVSPEAEARPVRAPAGEGGRPAQTQLVLQQTREVETVDAQEPRPAAQIADGAATSSGPQIVPPPEVRTIERVITERFETRTIVAEATPKLDLGPPLEASGSPSVAQGNDELVPLKNEPSTEGQDRDAGGATIVVAETIVPPERPDSGIPAADAAPFVIEIGRIDIRIESEMPIAPAMTARAAARPSSVPSLGDYLARRSEGRP